MLALYLFSMGFLLVREALPDINTSTHTGQEPHRVILILIDAMRVDFALSNKFSFMNNRNPNQTLVYLSISDSPTVTSQRI